MLWIWCFTNLPQSSSHLCIRLGMQPRRRCLDWLFLWSLFTQFVQCLLIWSYFSSLILPAWYNTTVLAFYIFVTNLTFAITIEPKTPHIHTFQETIRIVILKCWVGIHQSDLRFLWYFQKYLNFTYFDHYLSNDQAWSVLLG